MTEVVARRAAAVRAAAMEGWKVPKTAWPGNVRRPYVYLKTLLNPPFHPQYYGPDAIRVGQKALAVLGKIDNPQADIQTLDTIVKNLNFVVENERMKELKFLKQIKSDFKIRGPLFSNPANLYLDYMELTRLLNETIVQQHEFISKLHEVKRDKNKLVSRRTQEFYQYFATNARNLLQAHFKSSKKQIFKKHIGNHIFDIMDIVLARALAEMLQDPTFSAQVESLYEKLRRNDQSFSVEDMKFADTLANMIKAIRKPSGLDSIMPDVKKESLNKNLTNTDIKELLKKNIRKKHKKMRTFSVANFMKIGHFRGYPTESLAVWLMNQLSGSQTTSTGASLRKTDALSVFGDISIDIEELQSFFEKTEIEEEENMEKEQDKKIQTLMDFSQQYVKKLQNIAGSVEKIQKGFIVHTSVKDYQDTGISRRGGFEGGTMRLKEFSTFLHQALAGMANKIDIGFIIYSLNNLGPEALGDQYMEKWVIYLAAYLGAFAFDDHIALYSKRISKQIQAKGIHTVHLFFLNVTYIPFSFILQQVLTQLELLQHDMRTDAQVASAMQKYVNVKITPPTNYQSQLDRLSLVRDDRWRYISEFGLTQTRISVRFLKDFNTIFAGIRT